MKEFEQKKMAKAFVKRWQGKGYEKGESQKFWIDLIMNVFGIEQPTEYMEFEVQIMLEHISFIDVYIPSTKVIIEQKSMGKSLNKAIKQSDGTMLSPMQQMLRYANNMNYSVKPRWGISCNFQEFMIFDFDNIHGEPEIIKLQDLPNELHRLDFLVSKENVRTQREVEISIAAGAIVGKIYDALRKNYKEETEETLKSLNILCVRLIFCLYAEDAGIFSKDQFYKYMKTIPETKFRGALIELFEVLNTPVNERDEYMDDDLADFPYVNGGLFAGDIIIPKFDVETVNVILEEASIGFNWEHISPTIFGAVFESTLSTKLRRAGGMHYTSIENIHKVIDPLFLDELNKEFDSIMEIKQIKSRKNLLEQFQNKLAGLTFLDPACGSGNFLTETFISLRKLENKILMALYTENASAMLDFGDEFTPIKVNIHQFYGIEINDFAVSVAKTALWIAEYQMLEETQSIVNRSLDFLPLKSYSNIVEGNALRIDWKDVIAPEKLNYIMGNPPFIGFKMQNDSQRNDMKLITVGVSKRAGFLDYVCGWYIKTVQYIKDYDIKCAFVSTNSITQGEQPSILWKYLWKFNVEIIFAHTTFCWNSESFNFAKVHCVIIGFMNKDKYKLKKRLYIDNNITYADNINPYLITGDNILVEASKKPICDTLPMIAGNKTVKCLALILDKDEYIDLVSKEPQAKKYIKKMIGAEEFINNIDRYCLWLVKIEPNTLKSMPLVLKRVEQVRKDRLSSKDKQANALADRPTTFRDTRNPESAIIVPLVSSQKRKYIPMGYINNSTIANNKVSMIPDGTIYQFGILTSNVHNSWMRVVAMRMKSDYSYSVSIVYNTFPWCNPTEKQKEKIEKTAQAILDARALYPDSSLADLYDELTMPPELRKAHQANDRAVMEAYGFIKKVDGKATWYSPSECVAALMKMYQELTSNEAKD